MICELFTCLSRIGYQYRTSLSTGYPVCLSLFYFLTCLINYVPSIPN
jgi:hypothetical protein